MQLVRWTGLIMGLLAGCGGGGSEERVDAHGGAADARPDATPDAAGPACGRDADGEITVVHRLAGVPLVFHDADGCVRGQTVTNAFGIAHGEVTAGGMVTAVEPGQVFTITAIQPGDTIQMSHGRVAPWNRDQNIVVDFVPEPDAYGGRFWTGCGGTYDESEGLIAPSQFGTNRCGGSDDAMTILAVESRPGGFSWAAIEDFALDPSGTTALTLPAWRTDLATTQVAMTNLPTDTDFVYATLIPVEDGLAYGCSASFCTNAVAPTGGAAVLDLGTLPGFGDGIEVNALLQHASATGPVSFQRLYRDLATVPSTIDVDASTDFLPPLAVSWNGDVGQPEVTWSATGPGATPDAVIVSLTGELAGYGMVWFVVVPPGQTEVRLPALPDGAPTFTVDSMPGVGSFDRSDIADYAAARTQVFDLAEVALYDSGWPYHVVSAGLDARFTYADGSYLP